MCKIKELDRLRIEAKLAEQRYKEASQAIMKEMAEAGVDTLYSEDHTKYAKLIHIAESNINYIRKAYDCLKVF